jgi:hypothetical protein
VIETCHSIAFGSNRIQSAVLKCFACRRMAKYLPRHGRAAAQLPHQRLSQEILDLTTVSGWHLTIVRMVQ